MELQTVLASLPAFEEFGPAQIAALAQSLEPLECPSGHVLIAQGQQGDGLYLLLDGLIKVSRRSGDGSEDEELVELGAGEMFGVLALVDQLPAGASCTALTPVRVARLSLPGFKRLFVDALPLARHLQYMIAVQLARDISAENTRQRRRLMEQPES